MSETKTKTPAPTHNPDVVKAVKAGLERLQGRAPASQGPTTPPASPTRQPAPAEPPPSPEGGDTREAPRDDRGRFAPLLGGEGSEAGGSPERQRTETSAPSGDGAGDSRPSAFDDLAESFATGKPRVSDEEARAGLLARGYDEATIPVLLRQMKRKELDRILATPVRSGGTTDRPSDAGGAAAPGQSGAGDTDAELAGIEAELLDSGLLEEGTAKALVGLLRRAGSGRDAASNAEIAALRAKVEQLEAGSGASSEARREQYRTQLESARAKAAGTFPGAADDAIFDERIRPEIERLYRTDPSLVNDIEGLVLMASARVFREGGRTQQDFRPTPSASYTGAAASGTKPDPRRLAASALSEVMVRGRSPEDVLAEVQRRFGRR